MRKILNYGALILGGCLVFMLAGELVMRFLWTGWKDAREELARFEYKEKEEINIVQPFREKLPATAKVEGVSRIIVLGDSLTWGDKVADPNDTWPRVLAKKLQQQLGAEHAVEVANLAVRGFTTANEQELLERTGWSLSPDLVIVAFCLNDPLPSDKTFARILGEEWLYSRSNLIPHAGTHVFFDRYSYFYSFANEKYKSVQKRLGARDYHWLYREEFPGWQQCKTALGAIVATANKRGARALLVIFPSFETGVQTRARYRYSDIHDKVARLAKTCGFSVLDLLDVFIAQNRDWRDWHAFKLDAHPNAAAHEIAAEAIKNAILQRGLFTGAVS